MVETMIFLHDLSVSLFTFDMKLTVSLIKRSEMLHYH